MKHQINATQKGDVVEITGNLGWNYAQDPATGMWIAACTPMRIVIEAFTLTELHALMYEAIDATFAEMAASGDLDTFLKGCGWKMNHSPRSLGARGAISFDVPTHTRRVAPSDLNKVFC